MVEYQRTLKSAVKLLGIGLHTGEKVTIELCPAPENHGDKFQRTDVEGEPIIEADADLVVSTERGTTLEKNGVKVYFFFQAEDGIRDLRLVCAGRSAWVCRPSGMRSSR